MSRVLSGGLGALALMLVLVLFLEHQGQRPEHETLTSSHRLQSPAAQAGELAPRSDRSPEWVSIILGRPLFDASRRPPPGVSAGGTVAVGLPRLSGVLVTGSQKRAIFAGRAGGKAIVAGEGAHVGAYVVQSIGIGWVKMTGADGTVVLRPSFDAAASAKARPTAFVPELPVPAAELGQPSLLDRVRNGPTPIDRPAQ